MLKLLQLETISVQFNIVLFLGLSPDPFRYWSVPEGFVVTVMAAGRCFKGWSGFVVALQDSDLFTAQTALSSWTRCDVPAQVNSSFLAEWFWFWVRFWKICVFVFYVAESKSYLNFSHLASLMFDQYLQSVAVYLKFLINKRRKIFLCIRLKSEKIKTLLLSLLKQQRNLNIWKSDKTLEGAADIKCFYRHSALIQPHWRVSQPEWPS